MVVELISVGTEILLGNIVNTNAAYLAEKCALLGCSLYHQTVVGDNEERMEDAIRQALDRSDIVILTGGLGPTKDDLTKEVTARVFGRELYLDEHSKERIEAYFGRIGSSRITENNWKQALVPEGAIVIDNHNGTAPGLIIEDPEKGKTAILNLSERFSDGCASDAVKSILEMSGSVPIRMYSAITLTTRLTRLPNRQITSLCCTSPR